VQTVDFFAPVCDDPYQYGLVAAANSLSDVYAMGGVPLTALSLVCFPSNEADMGLLGEILRGGAAKCVEAACTIVGGHSLRDNEIKFGLAVTGTVHPRHVTSNDGARPGDRLFLTKALGMSPVITAFRKQAISAEHMNRALAQMATLNKAAAEAMRAVGIVPPDDAQGVHVTRQEPRTQGNGPGGVTAATDVTGFGLLGHARNIALASDATLVFRAAALPIFEGVLDFTAQKMNSGAYKQNQNLLQGQISLPENFDERLHRVIFDAETSGGLLIAVSADKGGDLLRELKARGVNAAVEVGFVERRSDVLLKVV
jgi:selenide,water dikinase